MVVTRQDDVDVVLYHQCPHVVHARRTSKRSTFWPNGVDRMMKISESTGGCIGTQIIGEPVVFRRSCYLTSRNFGVRVNGDKVPTSGVIAVVGGGIWP